MARKRTCIRVRVRGRVLEIIGQCYEREIRPATQRAFERSGKNTNRARASVRFRHGNRKGELHRNVIASDEERLHQSASV
jgi:hypothetical protein